MSSINLANLPTTDSTQLFRFRDRQYAGELMAVAILDWGLFDWFSDRSSASIEEVCDHFKSARRPTDVLLTLCRASGVLELRHDGQDMLSRKGAEYFVSKSPWYLGPYFEPYRNSTVYDGFKRVLATDKPANWNAASDGNDWHRSMMQEEFARGFTAIMNCRGIVLGQHLAAGVERWVKDKKYLVDVGGGSGIYAMTMLAKYPNLTGAVLEMPPVDRIAREHIASLGYEKRLEVRTTDMFKDDWPSCDVLLMSNVLHDWGLNEIEKLLTKAVKALKSGGVLLLHEAFLNNSKTGPLPVAEYSALLMHITQGRCYAPCEYADMLKKAGLELIDFQPTAADRGFIGGVKP